MAFPVEATDWADIPLVLEDAANPGFPKVNPTIAGGDFRIFDPDDTLSNMDNLPTVSPAAGQRVMLAPSAAETDQEWVTIVAKDQTTPPEWLPQVLHFKTRT